MSRPAPLLFVIIWTLLVLASDAVILRNVFAQLGTLQFSSTTGRVTSSEIRTNSSGKGTSYQLAIEYTYTVDGREFSGKRVYYGAEMSGSGFQQLLSETVAQFPKDSETRVFYNPKDPADAVLLTGVRELQLFIGIFMLPFNAVMLLLCGSRLREYRERNSPAPGVEVFDTGASVRLRMPRYSPAGVAIGAVGAAGLIALVVCGVNGLTSFGSMAAAWAIILTSGVVAYGISAAPIRRGEHDMVIDSTTMTIPAAKRKKKPTTIALNSISRIHVLEKSYPSNRNSYFVVRIEYYKKETRRSRRVLESRSSERAERLAGWLQSRLKVRSSNAISR